MKPIPGFAINTGIFKKTRAPVFYPEDYGYLYPPLNEDDIGDLSVHNIGVLFDFSGIYLGKPALRKVKETIAALGDMNVWLYSGVRNIDDLIDAVVMEPEGVFVSTATAQSPEDMEDMFSAAEIAALVIDMDSKGNIIWYDSTKAEGIDTLLEWVVEYELIALGIFFWDGTLSGNLSSIQESYNLMRVCESMKEWNKGNRKVSLFLAGPFNGKVPEIPLKEEGNIYIVLPYDTLD